MKRKLLNIGKLPPALMQRLSQSYDLVTLAEQTEPKAYLASHGKEFEAATSSSAVAVDPIIFESLSKLRVLSNFGVGLDRLDLPMLAKHGIAVGYTPDVLNDCVADTAIGLMIDIARRMSEADRFVRRGDWLRGPFPLSRKISGARLGIVGMGRIGRAIAQRGTGFAMDIRYHSRRAVAEVSWQHEPVLMELARWADYLVVITAGGAGTRHLINAPVLDALGPEGFLINVARGSVVDEAALVTALKERRIAGAGLDVYEDEPRVSTGLLTLDNVVLLPHVASATVETRQAMADRVFDNLQSFFDSGQLVSPAPMA